MTGQAAHGGDPSLRLHVPVLRDGGVEDRVAVEEPLEIRVCGRALAITMRTPGHDEELAAGFLHGEGLLAEPIVAAGPAADFAANVVDVDVPIVPSASERRFYTTSSCGVCGKGALEELEVIAPPLRDADGPRVTRALLAGLPDGLRQPGFAATGGLHATGRFDAAGELRYVREDVGRHNAMDKVVGRALLDGELPLWHDLLCVSGRLSFELVQKAAMAGCPVLVGVGAPSSLAVALAADRGITLAGFARGGHVNIYTAPHRVIEGTNASAIG
jgi:FdhD protein